MSINEKSLEFVKIRLNIQSTLPTFILLNNFFWWIVASACDLFELILHLPV